jgi:two-component system, chemotaxis family, chemotaxis protein CheY
MTARVLLVDDERDIRFMTRMTLAPTGWELEEATSGDEALEIIDTGSFDAVVLDQRMPGRSGIDTARELLARHNGTPRIVLFSAYLTPELERAAAELGVQTLDKASIRELRRLIEELLDGT